MTLINKAQEPIAQLVLAHGAGANMNSDFMALVAALFSQRQISVIRFDFEYMQKSAALNRRQPPDRMPKLLSYFSHVLEGLESSLPLFIGGKSMGGRVATMLLEESSAIAAVCLGYPFHPPGKLDKLRTEHLYSLHKPLLVVQGSRDTFGTQEEVTDYGLPENIETIFMADGDHSFKPRKKSGFTQEQHIISAIDASAEFIRQQLVMQKLQS
ncbi:alpha/beta family hydrolase [Paraglaciecola sp. L1A13]|uniref:alpha/beta family hydrolase n=1 Tax=Paraglaciecola sp. L1A13 TaxID=2686359 RepID=UPI00131DCBC9|nr:alpha/beta family hydrolase [Paraglaciecola sp. L1A13]